MLVRLRFSVMLFRDLIEIRLPSGEIMQRKTIMNHTTHIFGAALLVSVIGLGTSVAAAQSIPGKPDPAVGAELAAKLCSSCHVSKATSEAPVKADVPTFKEIANLEGRTEASIAGKIILPAHPMPTFNLTRTDIAHLVAYVMSLRTAE